MGLWAEISFLEALGGGLGLSILLQAGQVPGRGTGVWRGGWTRLRGFCVVAGIPTIRSILPGGEEPGGQSAFSPSLAAPRGTCVC